VLLHDVGADDVGGHQVGRELDARELEMEDIGQRVHQARLADPGDALEQDVPAGQERCDRPVHDVFVTDDAAADFPGDAAETLAELIDGLRDRRGCHRVIPSVPRDVEREER
jgi:hypothetical protein